MIRQLFHVKIFQFEEKNWLKFVYEKWALWFRESFEF